jgi:hypothetical protein
MRRSGGSLAFLPWRVSLNLHRPTHGIDRAGKLGQKVIARRIDYSATVLRDEGSHHLTISYKGANSRLFILAHEATVAFNIGTEDRSEFAFHNSFPRRRLSLQLSKVVKRATISPGDAELRMN